MRSAATWAITCLCALNVPPGVAAAADEPTTFFVVRHADRAPELDDGLSAAGVARANDLCSTLKYLRVSAIYVTDTERARKTAMPLAEARGLLLSSYTEPTGDWIAGLKEKHKGKVVLIVSHANTVHEIAGLLSGTEVAPIGNEFDNLFIVSLAGEQRSIVKLKYGAKTE